MGRKTKAEKYEAYRNYGGDWMQSVLISEGLDGWRGLNFDSFCQALANANCPPFSPEEELRIADPDGLLYELARRTAWMVLSDAILTADHPDPAGEVEL